MCKLHVSHRGGVCNGKKKVCSQIYNNLDRTKLPDFLQDMPEERLKYVIKSHKVTNNIVTNVIKNDSNRKNR